jgi:hypothetical protein
MVAALGALMVKAGRAPSEGAFDAESNLPVETLSL